MSKIARSVGKMECDSHKKRFERALGEIAQEFRIEEVTDFSPGDVVSDDDGRMLFLIGIVEYNQLVLHEEKLFLFPEWWVMTGGQVKHVGEIWFKGSNASKMNREMIEDAQRE